MGLNARQKQAFSDRCNIYKPLAWSMDTAHGNQVSGVGEFPAAPTYSAVPCYRQANPEQADPGVVGRHDSDAADVFDFAVGQDIRSGYALQLTSTESPDFGMWFQVVGAPQVLDFAGANTVRVLATRSIKPTGVS